MNPQCGRFHSPNSANTWNFHGPDPYPVFFCKNTWKCWSCCGSWCHRILDLSHVCIGLHQQNTSFATPFATPTAYVHLFPLLSIVFHDFPKNWSAQHITLKAIFANGVGVICNPHLQDAVSPILGRRGMQWFGTRSMCFLNPSSPGMSIFLKVWISIHEPVNQISVEKNRFVICEVPSWSPLSSEVWVC